MRGISWLAAKNWSASQEGLCSMAAVSPPLHVWGRYCCNEAENTRRRPVEFIRLSKQARGICVTLLTAPHLEVGIF
jgi:hypothetical protein